MWPWYWRVTWLCGWGPFILSHHSAKFGVHRPYGTRNNDVSNISSNSNAEVPMPRFTNGLLFDVFNRCPSNICYWEKLTFSNLRFSRKENLKKCTSLEEQKGTRYIRGNVCFGVIEFSCLSSTKPYLRFLLICFVREIKAFNQSS